MVVLILAILAFTDVYTLLVKLGTSKDRSIGHMAESSSLGESQVVLHTYGTREQQGHTRARVCVCVFSPIKNKTQAHT